MRVGKSFRGFVAFFNGDSPLASSTSKSTSVVKSITGDFSRDWRVFALLSRLDNVAGLPVAERLEPRASDRVRGRLVWVLGVRITFFMGWPARSSEARYDEARARTPKLANSLAATDAILQWQERV